METIAAKDSWNQLLFTSPCCSRTPCWRRWPHYIHIRGPQSWLYAIHHLLHTLYQDIHHVPWRISSRTTQSWDYTRQRETVIALALIQAIFPSTFTSLNCPMTTIRKGNHEAIQGTTTSLIRGALVVITSPKTLSIVNLIIPLLAELRVKSVENLDTKHSIAIIGWIILIKGGILHPNWLPWLLELISISQNRMMKNPGLLTVEQIITSQQLWTTWPSKNPSKLMMK